MGALLDTRMARRNERVFGGREAVTGSNIPGALGPVPPSGGLDDGTALVG